MRLCFQVLSYDDASACTLALTLRYLRLLLLALRVCCVVLGDRSHFMHKLSCASHWRMRK